jgi:hypothetical protein
MAAMRVRLGLTNEEIMKSSWISLQLQMVDFPYYNARAKQMISGNAAIDALQNKFMKK